jgi:hypothetical protein
MNRLLILLVSTIIFSTLSSAQEKKVELQFVSFPITTDPKPIELLVGNENIMTVEIPTNRISPTYQVNPISEWILGKSNKNKEGKLTFETYGKTPSLNSEKQLILVMRKGDNDTDGFELIAINNDSSNFGGGKYLFFNASKIDISGEIGESKFSIKPFTYAFIKPTPSEPKDDRKNLYVVTRFLKDPQSNPFYSSTWRYNERARTLVFFYDESFNERLKIHTIRDYLPER